MPIVGNVSLIKMRSLVHWITKVNEAPQSNLLKKFWENRKYEAFLKYYGICPVCNGQENFNVEEGTIECFCGTLKQWSIVPFQDEFESYFRHETLDTIIHFDVPKGAAEVTAKHLASIKKRFINPAKWVVLCGGTGSAKTHILYAIKTHFTVYAHYITSSELTNLIMVTTKTGDLDRLIYRLIHAPMLLIDDFGMEHKSKSEYAFNILVHIIDQRYSLGILAPTWISTNIPWEELAADQDISVRRVASRLLDVGFGTAYEFTQADYRLPTERGKAAS